MNYAAHAPALMPEVQPAGQQTFHPQCTTTCATMSHLPQTSSSQKHGIMTSPPLTEEHFPTAPLDDDVWAEEPIPDRCLYIHERPDEPNHQCSYPCPYKSTTVSMDLLQSTP